MWWLLLCGNERESAVPSACVLEAGAVAPQLKKRASRVAGGNVCTRGLVARGRVERTALCAEGGGCGYAPPGRGVAHPRRECGSGEVTEEHSD